MTHQCSRPCITTWAFLFWSLKVAIHPTFSSHSLIDDVQHSLITFNNDRIRKNSHEIRRYHPHSTLKFALKNNAQRIRKQCYQRNNYRPHQPPPPPTPIHAHTYTHTRAHTRTHTHTYTHTHYFSLTGTVCQKSRSSVVGSFTDIGSFSALIPICCYPVLYTTNGLNACTCMSYIVCTQVCSFQELIHMSSNIQLYAHSRVKCAIR